MALVCVLCLEACETSVHEACAEKLEADFEVAARAIDEIDDDGSSDAADEVHFANDALAALTVLRGWVHRAKAGDPKAVEYAKKRILRRELEAERALLEKERAELEGRLRTLAEL